MKDILEYFQEINRIPRGSGNTAKMSAYICDFAKRLDLLYQCDDAGNVVIFKPAQNCSKDLPAVILQGHMDMVCEKTDDSDHDFLSDPIINIIDQDGFMWSKSHTTLGGDDGIALAYMMAILEDHQIKHPALECIFTVDEEIGLLGAAQLAPYESKATYMLNLDNEQEHQFVVSCAGGGCVTIEQNFVTERMDDIFPYTMEITVSGLRGGHSGAEIHCMRGNANKILGRVLAGLAEEMGAYSIVSLNGGTKDNAITRSAVCTIKTDDKMLVAKLCRELDETIAVEYHTTDENITIRCKELLPDEGNGLEGMQENFPSYSLRPSDTMKVIFLLEQIPYGVESMCQDMPDLVETSSNPGILSFNAQTGHFTLVTSVRSNVASKKTHLMQKIIMLGEYLGFECYVGGEYPAWPYKKDSMLRQICKEVHDTIDQDGKQASFETIHAGLECGIFSEMYPSLDIVSMGPDMYDIHTPNEHLSVKSAYSCFDFVCKVLDRLAQ